MAEITSGPEMLHVQFVQAIQEVTVGWQSRVDSLLSPEQPLIPQKSEISVKRQGTLIGNLCFQDHFISLCSCHLLY